MAVPKPTATGCSEPTPSWGYAYWGKEPDGGASDMLIYCEHSAANKSDPWARTCGPLRNASRGCVLQHIPLGPLNNTAAAAFWASAADHAEQAGWRAAVFDYSCDEPGGSSTKADSCRERGAALARPARAHVVDEGRQVRAHRAREAER